MNDEMEPMRARTPADAELARRLEAYAQARLSPDAATSARIRARVMREARVRFEAVGSLPVDPSTPTSLADPSATGAVAPAAPRRAWRLPAALLAASLSTALLAGVAAGAARPGGPLYGARLWVEELSLPAGGAARREAEIDLLRRRLDEATDAATAGDSAGAAAALATYQRIVDDAVMAAGSDPTFSAALDAELANHLAVLQQLLGTVPPQARSGIQQAIENSEKARHDVENGRGPAGPPPGQTKTPAPKPSPDRTPKPDRTPRPGPTTPATTPRPTPRGEPGGPAATGAPQGGPSDLDAGRSLANEDDQGSR